MAELILTAEEKAAALWSDLDDASLGKFVKKLIVSITNASEQMDRTAVVSAAMLICCEAVEANADRVRFDTGRS